MSNCLGMVRVREGLSKKELGTLAGLSERTIHRAENEEGNIRNETKYKILNALNRKTDRDPRYTFAEIFN